jgi:tetratricopeptide (TPR) repeat protein
MTTVSEPSGTLAVALEHTTRLLNSNPEQASEQASEILKVVPNHPVATLLLGIARRAAGNAVAALEALEPLLVAQPQWAAAHYELGLTLGVLEHHDAALGALRRAVALKPDLPDARREIGDQLTIQGDVIGADAAYARHIKASTKDPRLGTDPSIRRKLGRGARSSGGR